MKLLYLLDTNIISELSKIEPNKNVLDMFSKNVDYCSVSAVTIQELVYGLELMPDGKRKKMLNEFINRIKVRLPILEFNPYCADLAGSIMGKCERNGKPRPSNDTQIAATALANNLILVTRNIKDFEPMKEVCVLNYENWFDE